MHVTLTVRATAAVSLMFMLFCCSPAAAASPDPESDFFREEAEFYSAALRSVAMRKSPLSVEVIGAAEIKASGASTIWDALRLAPGVDVVETRTGQGDVSIRGFNQSNSDRVLVLLDGMSVMQDFYGITVWEEIPVGISEIDHIEIVKGPASSLYGANAINGVINIITKKPEQLAGGEAGVSVGNRDASLVSAVYGRRAGKYSWKAGADYKEMNRFGDGELLASRVSKAHAYSSYEPAAGVKWDLAGGLSRVDNQLGLRNRGVARPDGTSANMRAGYSGGGFRARTFLYTNNFELRDFWGGPDLKSSVFDASMDQELRPADNDTLVAGFSYRRNAIESGLFDPGTYHQHIWSAFAENTWEPSVKWSLVAGARLDRHSLCGSAFSPNISVIYFPDGNNTLRFSAGTAFRNPNLIENYLHNTQTLPLSNPSFPGFTSAAASFSGNRDLAPERMKSVEIAYNGVFDRFKAGLAVYAYTQKDLINIDSPSYNITTFPTLGISSGWSNTGTARAVGGELSAEYAIGRAAGAFGNYSYFNASETGRQNDSHNSPRHKASGGLKYLSEGFSGMLWTSLAGPTWWDDNVWGAAPALRRVAGYMLFHAGASYRLRDGLEVRLKAFNLFDKRHYEVLPYRSDADVGHYGEVVGARYAAELSYRF